MQLRRLLQYPCVFLLVLVPAVAFGQTTTYHLHKETSQTGGGVLQLKTSGPDAGSTAFSSVDLRNRPTGDYPIKSFDTAAGSPSASGVIPAGSTVSALLWMRKTASVGAMYPKAKVTLNSEAGPTVCSATGAAPLTTTMTAFVLNCSTPATVGMTVTDRFYVAVSVTVGAAPGNKAVKVELRLEGTLNGNHDSTVTLPMPATVTPPPSETAGPATYAYDALGRVIQATNAAGQSAIYRYDAVGNILAIERPGNGGSSATAISGFTPSRGPVGTSVAIAGSGFSSAPAENVVTFNGAAASVTAASAAGLVAVVPDGATTGPIGVLSPAGSATSAALFTVVDDGGPPMITGLTPAIGVSGTPFTITGTNFETSPANNRVTLNIRPADVTASATTALATTVPLASMGGRITLATPSGTVVSGADFVVVPSPYTPADVESSQRIAPGESRTMSIGTAGRIALLLFDGVAGQFVSATSTSSTWTSCQFGGQYSLTLFRPDASIHTLVTNACGGSTLMDHQTLPITGTYTLMLDPIGSNVGSTTISLYSGVDVIGTITADGTPVPVTISTPTQKARLTFDGIAGQVVSATVSDATFPGNCLSYAFSLSIVKPDGSSLPWAPSCGGSVFMDQRTLPVSGTYTLILDPGWTGTGSATIRLYTVSDIVGSITADGTSIPVSITTPGQNARLAFAGTAGQVVSGLVTGATIPGNCSAYAFYLTLLKPDGTSLRSVPSCGGGVFLDRQTLPVSGTYTLVLDPGGASTGNATVTLYTVVDVVSPIADGASIPVAIATPGQNARFTFTGTPGQVVTGLVSNATIPGNCAAYAFYLTLVRPDGSVQASIPSCGGGVFLDRQTLSATGTYTLLLDPVGANTGAANVSLYTVVDVTGPIAPNGPSVPVTVTTPGQNVRLTFTGTAGQVVTAWTANNTIPGSCFSYAFHFSIVKPDGSTLVSIPSCGGNVSLGQRTLPVAGTYTIVINPADSRTGSITITLTSP